MSLGAAVRVRFPLVLLIKGSPGDKEGLLNSTLEDHNCRRGEQQMPRGRLEFGGRWTLEDSGRDYA